MPKSGSNMVYFHILTSTRTSRHNSCTFSTSQRPKVVQDRQFLAILTLKCDPRHKGVHIFNFETSKSGPRRSVFKHSFLTSKCALRHNSVQFFISHLARWLPASKTLENTVLPKHWKTQCFVIAPASSFF